MAPDLFQKFAGVVLRPFLPTDIGWAYEIETHPSIIQRFRLAGSTPNMATYRDFFVGTSNSRAVVVDESAGERIGFLYTFNTNLNNGRTSLALVCDPAHHGSGMFYRGAWLFIDYLFQAFPFTRIYGQSLEFNFEQFRTDGARRLNIDGLIQVEGILKEHQYLGGRWWDEYLISVTKQEWMSRRQETRDWLESDYIIQQEGGTVEGRYGSGSNRGIGKTLLSNKMMEGDVARLRVLREADSEWVPRTFASPRNRASVVVRGGPISGPLDEKQIDHVLWHEVLAQFVIEDRANGFALGLVTAYGVDWSRQTVSIHLVLEETGLHDDVVVPWGICQFIEYVFHSFPFRRLYLQYPEDDETFALVWSTVERHRPGAIAQLSPNEWCTTL